MNKETFCLAPWYGICVDTDKKVSPCCKFKDRKKFSLEQINEYWSSDVLLQVRQDLLKGVKNKNCQACWDHEALGKGDSYRKISNRIMSMGIKKDLRKQLSDPKIENIVSFELNLGNLCNLKCTFCDPTFSSQLLAETTAHPELYSRYGAEYDQKTFDWPKQQDFVEWCEKYLPQAVHIKFNGGEPFLIPWIPKVLDSIPDSLKSKCVLHFTTNLTTVNDNLFSLFAKFKEVWLTISVEGTEDTHEYLRYGHSWSLFTKNIKKVLDKQIKNLYFSTNYVVQAPSYHSIMKMVKYFDALELKIFPILVTTHEHFHISALTKKAKLDFLDSTKNYNGHNTEFINFVRSASEKYIEQDKALAKKCVQDLARLDHIRGNDYKKVIPAGYVSIE